MIKVLVAYASKRGSTAEIAQAIADELTASGLSVDCAPAGEVRQIKGYDAIVLGSAVYMRRWQGDARHFLRKHSASLAQTPFWVFSSGPVGEPSSSPKPSWLEPPRVMRHAEKLGVRGHVVFGGRVPTEPHGPIERSMVENTPEEYRDLRDWKQIRGWAAEIAAVVRELPVSRRALAAR
jgi:menaquinone-dependent protoporphyrinogen oxidase